MSQKPLAKVFTVCVIDCTRGVIKKNKTNKKNKKKLLSNFTIHIPLFMESYSSSHDYY